MNSSIEFVYVLCEQNCVLTVNRCYFAILFCLTYRAPMSWSHKKNMAAFCAFVYFFSTPDSK